MTTNQPNKIYRYQAINQKTIESLCHDFVYFSDPATFNDPLDCKPKIVQDSADDILRSILAELIKRRVENESIATLHKADVKGDRVKSWAQQKGEKAAKEKLSDIIYWAKDPAFDGSEEAEKYFLIDEIRSEILRQYNHGLCCFASSAINPLLWSHYADKHQGICIGYGLNRTPQPVLHKVVYGGSRSMSYVRKWCLREP